MWCLRMRWCEQCFHLTRGGTLKEVPAISDEVMLFHTADSAKQYLRYAMGLQDEGDVYPAYVGITARRTAKKEV